MNKDRFPTPRLDEPVPGGRPRLNPQTGLRLGEVTRPSPVARHTVHQLGHLRAEHFAAPAGAPQAETPGASAAALPGAPLSESEVRDVASTVAHLLCTASVQGLRLQEISPMQVSLTLGVRLQDVEAGLSLIEHSSEPAVRSLLPRVTRP